MLSKRTYTSAWNGWRSFLTSIKNDIRAHRQDSDARVSSLLSEARAMEQLLFKAQLEDADILDVGPGQVPVQLIYFSRENRALGIDVNRIIYPLTPLRLLQVACTSGPIRAAKTLGRWLLGSDTRLLQSVAQSFGVKTVPWPRILQMDVRQMDLPDESYDFVYSRSVFQHITQPEYALKEIVRVLRSGGKAFISLHLWTCPNGYTYIATTGEWPHLRNQVRPDEIDQSRNRLRYAEWRKLFNDAFPGCEIRLRGQKAPAMIARAVELHKTELSGYSLEELINGELSVSWRKP